MKKFLPLLGLSMLCSCASNYTAGEGYEGYRIDEGKVYSFTPTDADVARAENCLRKMAAQSFDPSLDSLFFPVPKNENDSAIVQLMRDEMPFVKTHLQEYQRQYLGMQGDGDSLMLINGFHRDYFGQHPELVQQFRKELILPPSSGGAWFWHAHYDLRHDRLRDWVVEPARK